MRNSRKIHRILNIFIPVFLTVALFVLTIHLVILPTIEKQMMTQKREMIRELTNSAWGVLAAYEKRVQTGELSRALAQHLAAGMITELRYGPEGKDYFWINDMRPYMVSHPYRTDLNGKDISDFKDPNGKRLFVAFVDIVNENGAGYVDYMWQWKDDPNHIVPKISYVRGFKPWGWIVGTGIYVQDVKAEITRITHILIHIYVAILGVMVFLSAVVIRHSAIIERRRTEAEQNLTASMNLYSSLVENVHDMVFLLDAQGCIVFINSFVSNHFDVKPETVLGVPLCFFWCGPSIDQVDNAVALVAKIHKEYSLDCVCEDNYYFLSIVPLIDGSGTLEGMICVARDITKRKRAEESLRKSEEKYKALIENATQGIVVHQDGVFKYANPAALAMTGYSETEIRTIGLADLLCPQTASEKRSILETNEARLQGQFLDPIPEARIIDKNGIIKWVENSSIVIEWEGRPATMHFVSDITERRQAQNYNLELQQRYHTLFETAGDGIFVIQGSRFVDCNKKVLAQFRCTRNQIIGRAPDELSPRTQPDGKDSQQKAREKIYAAAQGEPQYFEWLHQRPDGTLFDAEISLNKFTLEQGDYIQAIVRDISDRKRAEAAIRESEVQLRALSQQLIKAQEQERKRLSRELHDELGQKLAGLKLEIATLKRKPDLLGRFLDSVDQLLGDVNTDLRRIYNALRPVTIDKLGLRQALIALINGQFEHSPIQVQVNIDESLGNRIPEEMSISIYRIFQEIFTNTIKHSQATRLSITLNKENNAIKLETTDNGTGFDEDMIHEKIGFGLLGMQERTRQHGGELRIESAPGAGVKISAVFPLEQEPC